MFGFMKKQSTDKEREEKEKRKKDKKDKKDSQSKQKKPEKSLTVEELGRLEEAKRGLFHRLSDSAKHPRGSRQPTSVTPSDSQESLDETDSQYTSTTKMEFSKTVKVPPATRPKPPKKGILKAKSTYGPEIPNQGVRGILDDTVTLEENTIANELMIEMQQKAAAAQLAQQKDASPGLQMLQQKKTKTVQKIAAELDQSEGMVSHPGQKPTSLKVSMTSRSRAAPPEDPGPPTPETPFSPSEKTYDNVELKLPSLAPPRCPKPREISLKRLPSGDYGFSLRRGTVLERGMDDDLERKRTVIFAEPGPKNNTSGLLPGDRLVEVNGKGVEEASREEIVELIKTSGNSVLLKVQPIPELSELSLRSGAEGEDVMIGEEGAMMGTLQRSGSMRFKSRPTKTEDQLATERAWLSGERVWLIHKGGFAGARRLPPDEGPGELAEGKCRVKLEHGGEVLEVDEDDVERANPPQFDRVEDLASLRYLNESSMLHTLRQRYGSNLIHSYGGQSLVILNPMHPLSVYSEKVIHMFKGCKPEDMPPHVYATAQTAYRNMLNTRHDQSLVFLGRSGSGKTTNARHALHFFTIAAGSVGGIITVEKLNSIFALLDAFGNSRTILNTSATRFTHIFSLDFDHAGQIASASIQVLMLEKTRVIKRPEGEPTFHVFYQMLAGIDSQLRKELQLENLGDPNLFMTPLQRNEDRQRATQAWAKIHYAMKSLGFTEEETKAIYLVLAAIYHLGVAGAMKGANNKYQFARPAAAQRAAAVLGTSVEELSRSIFSPSAQAARTGSPRTGGDKGGPAETVTGLEALEGFVVGLYAEVFNALVSLMNRCLSSNNRTISSVLILDSPGFQNPASCGRQTGARFEDLCHNYLQERLQLLFHDLVFTYQQDLYAQENIECDFEPLLSSPSPIINLIDKSSQSSLVRTTSHERNEAEEKGLFWMLDEEAIYPGSSDETFLKRVLQTYGRTQHRKEALLKKGPQPQSFIINHYQGTNPVHYTTKGWLKVSRENPVSKNVNPFLQESHRTEIGTMFSTIRVPGSSTLSGSIVGIEGSSSLRRASSIRRSYTTGAAGLKRKSVCLQVKYQADSIVDMLRRTRAHFIVCVLPQHNAGLCDLRAKSTTYEDFVMNVPLVRSQIRGIEVVEAIRIFKQGFPEHLPFEEFKVRFQNLLPADARPPPGVDAKQVVEKVLEYLEVEKTSYRLGLSQVFFRSGGLAKLEDARDEKISDFIISTQALCRRYLAQQKVKKLKLQHLAASCIQRNVRKFVAIRDWPWWRLYTKVKPLLNVHRTEEELKDIQIELEQLKMKYTKLEKERNDYKHAVDKLENKLGEMNADLAEEHSTSNHATEMLEGEQAERMKLEKDFKDMQSKYNGLLRKLETTEMDLMQARMFTASMDGEYDDDDEDGEDSIYRERYERTRKEMDFMKKKLQQQYEDEVEQYETSKKQMDRKLAEAIEDADEQQRQVANWKRKSQRINQDMTDVKLHLEEQYGRNADLEKRQRKFDNELLKASEISRQEKQQREKVQRERDDLSAQVFTTDQELKNLKLDNELQADKIARLERELQELSTTDNKDDKELLQMKRLKNDYEAKLQEQEEELDDQAGSIQQLSQAKLKLEMYQEKMRQEHAKELDEKEQELEDQRASTHKKVRTLESQLEDEYSEKQSLGKEKRELERRLLQMAEVTPSRDRDTEKRLRRDLKRTKALLQDAQMMLEKNKEGGTRATIKQLRNQLEDAEYATAAAVKARKGIELEVQELQLQIDAMSKSKQELEDRCMNLTREKNDLQTQAEEGEEDMSDLMKKYKAAVQQLTIERTQIQEQTKQIEELVQEKQLLQEQVIDLQSKVDFHMDTMVDKQLVARLETKIRDLESRLELEQTTRHRAELQTGRLKEQVDRLSDVKEKAVADDQKQQEEIKRTLRQTRDVREELGDLQRKEAEASQRKHDLEQRVESLESDYEQSQSDLRLAFKRIADLQAAMEDEIIDDSDDDDSDIMLDSDDDSDSDDELDSSLVNHRPSRYSRASSSSEDRQRPLATTEGSRRVSPPLPPLINAETCQASDALECPASPVSNRVTQSETPPFFRQLSSSSTIAMVYADGEYV